MLDEASEWPAAEGGKTWFMLSSSLSASERRQRTAPLLLYLTLLYRTLALGNRRDIV